MNIKIDENIFIFHTKILFYTFFFISKNIINHYKRKSYKSTLPNKKSSALICFIPL